MLIPYQVQWVVPKSNGLGWMRWGAPADGPAGAAWGKRACTIPLGLLLELPPFPPAACCMLGTDVGAGASCLDLLLPAAACLLGTDAEIGAS